MYPPCTWHVSDGRSFSVGWWAASFFVHETKKLSLSPLLNVIWGHCCNLWATVTCLPDLWMSLCSPHDIPHMCGDAHMHVCMCIQRPKVDVRNHPQLLSHLVCWGRVCQSNPGLTCMSVLCSQTALVSPLSLPSKAGITCLPGICVGSEIWTLVLTLVWQAL